MLSDTVYKFFKNEINMAILDPIIQPIIEKEITGFNFDNDRAQSNAITILNKYIVKDLSKKLCLMSSWSTEELLSFENNTSYLESDEFKEKIKKFSKTFLTEASGLVEQIVSNANNAEKISPL